MLIFYRCRAAIFNEEVNMVPLVARKGELYGGEKESSQHESDDSTSKDLPPLLPKSELAYDRVFKEVQENKEPRQDEGKSVKAQRKTGSDLFTWTPEAINKSLRGEQLIPTRADMTAKVVKTDTQRPKIADESKAPAQKSQSDKSHSKKGITAITYSERCRHFKIIDGPKTW